MIVEESFNFGDDTRAFLSLDPTATPINETTSLEEGRESGFESAVAIGESATVGGWELKVVAITPDGTDEVMEENQFNDPPPEGNQFFIASLEATYTGPESFLDSIRGRARARAREMLYRRKPRGHRWPTLSPASPSSPPLISLLSTTSRIKVPLCEHVGNQYRFPLSWTPWFTFWGTGIRWLSFTWTRNALGNR